MQRQKHAGSDTLEKSKKKIILALLVAALFVRCLVLMHPHSGQGKPPMYGDYEAQRHWMEITTALPVDQWYVNGTDNDLQYWGLDYPPLTAYHSYVVGWIGKQFIPEAFELHTSRGFEDYDSKVFMKLSVLISELLVYIPGVYFAVTGVAFVKQHDTACQIDALALLWLHPCILLVDHGHFQYNTVCFGLTFWAIGFIARHHYLVGSFFFVCAMLFKQIALYYAPAFFFGILGLCFSEGFSSGIANVVITGTVVLGTAALVFYPWIASGDPSEIIQVLHRMFPFARGLYEDKVANVWCSLSLVYKLNRHFDQPTIVKIAAGATLTALIPGCVCCLQRRYGSGTWVAALVISALSFFLFSFQVHEKSIMFPVVVSALLPAASPQQVSSHVTRAVAIATFVGLFSMYPLVVKDRLYVMYVSLSLATAACCELTCVGDRQWRTMWRGVLASVVVVHAVHFFVPAPDKYPDLWTMLICGLSCAYFCIALIALTVAQFRCAFDLRFSRKVE